MAVLKNYQTKAEEYRSRRRLPYTGLIEETVSLVSQLS